MFIYELLFNKPNNPHYLNRYITFIEACKQKNVNIFNSVEKHHILPKCKNMFPEYKNFSIYPENKAILTSRQHYIAHRILHLAFPSILGLKYSYLRMSMYRKYNSKLYEKHKLDFMKNQSDNAKIQTQNMTENQKQIKSKKLSNYSKNMVSVIDIQTGNKIRISKLEYQNNKSKYVGITKGLLVMKDKNGICFSVKKNDPRVISGELVGLNKGKKFDKYVGDKLRAIHTGRIHKKITCPHCDKTGGITSMKRWHFDNCKLIRA